jgi:hypothetical protein
MWAFFYLYFLTFNCNRHTAANTVRVDATVAPGQVPCCLHFSDFSLLFLLVSNYLCIIQADTFDDELKKLVGMGFEKVLERFIMNVNYIVGFQLFPCLFHLPFGLPMCLDKQSVFIISSV